MLELLKKEIELNSDPVRAEHNLRYFKTKKGEYGEGDIFLGLTMPTIRILAKKYINLELNDIQKLLDSKYHEYRLVGLIILVNKYKKKNSDKKTIVDFYLNNTKNINNWDLVDMSAYNILGDYLLKYNNLDYAILKKLSKSKNLWERRISIISTMTFVKNGIFEPTIDIAKVLLKNEHDLINKAVGWLLREIGKKNKELLVKFLENNIKDISSITLSYSTEKFDKEEINRIKELKRSIKLSL